MNSAPDRMLAVTIGVGERWERLATETAKGVTARTGLETRILGATEMAHYQVRLPHHLKFKLFDALPVAESILYFDADTLFFQRWDPRQFAGRRELICVRDFEDQTQIGREARAAGVALEAYFNSGLLILNRQHHAPLLAEAERLSRELVSVFHDQTYLNAARRVLGIQGLYRPREYNRLKFDPSGATRGSSSDIWMTRKRSL